MDVLEARMATFDDPDWDPEWEVWRTTYCCVPPIAAYQGDLLEATLTNEPIGEGQPVAPLHDLQVTGLHRPRLRHAVRSGRA